MVAPRACFYMITWLPLRRTSVKSFFARISRTSRPENRRSLGNCDFHLRNVYFMVQTTLYFVGRSGLKK